MKKYYCDRCGTTIETTYYKTYISAHDVDPTRDGRVTCETMGSQIRENLYPAFRKEQVLCRNCKNKIKAFINKKEK